MLRNLSHAVLIEARLRIFSAAQSIILNTQKESGAVPQQNNEDVTRRRANNLAMNQTTPGGLAGGLFINGEDQNTLEEICSLLLGQKGLAEPQGIVKDFRFVNKEECAFVSQLLAVRIMLIVGICPQNANPVQELEQLISELHKMREQEKVGLREYLVNEMPNFASSLAESLL